MEPNDVGIPDTFDQFVFPTDERARSLARTPAGFKRDLHTVQRAKDGGDVQQARDHWILIFQTDNSMSNH
jgi:hypothetical protein